MKKLQHTLKTIYFILILIGGNYQFFLTDYAFAQKDSNSVKLNGDLKVFEEYEKIHYMYSKVNDFPGILKIVDMYTNFIETNKENPLSISAQYELANINIFGLNNYQEGIEQLKKIVTKYPDTKFAVISQFLIATVYNKEIEDHGKALAEYRFFLEKYPSSPLSKTVYFEINKLTGNK